MNILLVGGLGSIGRRYHCILEKHLGYKVDVYDTANFALNTLIGKEYDGVIICTPTDQHYNSFLSFRRFSKKILIEKPVSKNLEEIKEIQKIVKKEKIDVRMVCNYKFVMNGKLPRYYNYYNTGRDGLYWDLIQLLYLNPRIEIETDSYYWNLKTCNRMKMDRGEETISYRDLELGYYDMLETWIKHPEELWDMNDAYKATKTVLERIKHEQDSNPRR
jgi:hypothetical protein